jgi:hypothetical protein
MVKKSELDLPPVEEQDKAEATLVNVPPTLDETIGDVKCKYRRNPVPKNAFARYAPPVCKCGAGHALFDLRKYAYRFVKTIDVEKRKHEGYTLFVNPEDGASCTCGGQVLMIIDRERVNNEREGNINGNLKIIGAQKVELAKMIRDSRVTGSGVVGGDLESHDETVMRKGKGF